MAKFCKKQAIFFKTKRGKTVRFVGRKSGSAVCGKRRPSAVQAEFRKAFRAIAKVCNKAGKGRSLAQRVALRRACWKHKTTSDRPVYTYKKRRSLR